MFNIPFVLHIYFDKLFKYGVQQNINAANIITKNILNFIYSIESLYDKKLVIPDIN